MHNNKIEVLMVKRFVWKVCMFYFINGKELSFWQNKGKQYSYLTNKDYHYSLSKVWTTADKIITYD